MTAPRVGFVIGGFQKSGTSALASYLRMHPGLRLPEAKEAHVFDDPAFDDAASREDIDRRFDAHFPAREAGCLYGDATPIYAFLPTAVERIARYNPAMRWLVVLRDPAARAISHYHMERARGAERWPLWAALLLERTRLRGGSGDLSWNSPLRTHSYLARGDYARQLDLLHAHFPGDQVRVLRTSTLLLDPVACLGDACRFLGVPPLDPPPAPRQVFKGEYEASVTGLWLARWLLRRELAELRARYGIEFPG